MGQQQKGTATPEMQEQEKDACPPLMLPIVLNQILPHPTRHDGYEAIVDPVNVSKKRKRGVLVDPPEVPAPDSSSTLRMEHAITIERMLAWKNALPTEVPHTYWMRKLLAQVKKDHLFQMGLHERQRHNH
jgi:hypothetical protein